MEAIRARLMASDRIVPLGKGKGIVQENLGQTSFRKVSEPPSSKIRRVSESDSSSSLDDIDFLSNATPSPPPSSMLSSKSDVKGKAKLSAAKVKSSPKRNGLKSKPKPKPRLKKPVKAKDSAHASLPKRLDDELEMPPSNQLAYDSQGTSSSPLEELSQNTLEILQKKGKRKAEVEDFPMDVEKIKSLKHLAENNSATLPVSPTKKQKTSHKKRKEEPAPFPMEIPKQKRPPVPDDNDGSVVSPPPSYHEPRPFPVNPSDIIRHIPVEYPPIPTQSEFTMNYVHESTVDPSKKCPYCDEILPEEPSPILQKLITKAKRKSYKDPRPGNPLGLMAPLVLFAEVCERHRLETNYLPLAISRGWPTKINFITIPDRIQRLKPTLDAMIADPKISSFWREVKDDMALIGRKKLASVTGQYATFEKSQPGYYGEQGSIIIQQTLYTLFPVENISEEAIEPLSAEQFLSQVLLPETATLLIMEDMNLPFKMEGLKVLEESKKYGIAMFPERAQDEAVAEVGERLARERALSRRKYLKEIGESEEDFAREIQEEKRIARGKGKEKLSVTLVSETDTDSGSCEQPRQSLLKVHRQPPKPKPKSKSREDIQRDELSDNETPRPAVKARKKASKKPAASSTSNQSRENLTLSDNNSDVPWTYNLRGNTQVAEKEPNVPVPVGGTSHTLDKTPKPKPKPKPKSRLKESATESSDREIISKPGPRPKPKLKRNLKPETALEGQVGLDSTKEDSEVERKDSYNWLLDDMN